MPLQVEPQDRWGLIRIPHVDEEVVLLLDRERLGEARRAHPGVAIYLREELDELARHRGEEGFPGLMVATHRLKKAFRGWVMPRGTHDGASGQPPPYPPPVATRFTRPVSPEARAKVDAIRETALSLGWSEEALNGNQGRFPFPCGPGYGLVCFLDGDRTVGKVTRESIEILAQAEDGRPHCLHFWNPDVRPPWIKEVDK